jgi:hypothetical protein
MSGPLVMEVLGQPLDPTLTALAALDGTTGILVETAPDTFAKRTWQAPAAGIGINNPGGVAGNPAIALANDLAALEALASTGFAARTGTDAWAQRTLTAGSAKIAVTNGNGVAGNPTVDLGSVAASDLSNGVIGSGSIVTPVLGVAGATSINKVAITAPATGATITLADGKTLTVSNTLTLAGTDGSTLNFGAGGTLGALALKSSVDLSGSDATGILAAARFPAMTGDVTTAAGALATSIANNAVTTAKINNGAVTDGKLSLTAPALGAPTAGSLAIAATTQLWLTGTRATGNLEFQMVNSNTAGYCVLNFGELIGTTQASMYALGSTWASSGRYQANSLTFEKLGAGGSVNFITPSTMTFFSSGGTGLMTMNSSGQFGFGIGTSFSPLARVEARSAIGAQFAASYDASNYLGVTVDSTGKATLAGAGTGKGISLTDGLVAGSGAARVRPGGTLKTIVTSAPNGTTVETDLHSATVVANTLVNDGDSLEVQMNFQVANNANNKTIKLYVDGTQVLTSGANAIAGQSAQIVATITRVSATVTIISVQFIPETGSAWGRGDKQPAQNIDWTGSRVIKATGQSSAAANDIVQRSTTINYDPANP